MRQKNPRILVVEDSSVQRANLVWKLKKRSYEVIEASSGEEANKLIVSEKPDAILLDWELADAEGPELVEVWAKDETLKWIPVLMLTAHTEVERVQRALEAGAVDYICKPPNEIELAARLSTALRIKYLQDQLRDYSMRDPLTGLFNRRYFSEIFHKELEKSRNARNNISCVIIDIDHFKLINDNYGHDVGDIVIKQMSEHLTKGVRKEDTVARFGGEEFVILMTDTDENSALMLLEKIHKAGREKKWGKKSKEIKVTFSAGIATLQGNWVESPEMLIKMADDALYAAKNLGRDRVLLAS